MFEVWSISLKEKNQSLSHKMGYSLKELDIMVYISKDEQNYLEVFIYSIVVAQIPGRDPNKCWRCGKAKGTQMPE